MKSPITIFQSTAPQSPQPSNEDVNFELPPVLLIAHMPLQICKA
jgi:hypothetical protein